MEYFEDWNLSLSKQSVDPAHRGRRHFSEALALIGHKVPFSKSLTFIIAELSLGQ